MDEDVFAEKDGFVIFPASSGGGALVRKSQIAGARANGQDGAIVYAKCGPSIYTTASVPQLAQFLNAEVADIRRN